MQRTLGCILFRIIVFLGALPCFAQNNAADKKQTYALVIGISTYKNQKTQLEYAHKDAKAFVDFLKSANGGNVPDENIKLLTNDQADIASIYNGLDWLKNQVKENDQAYFYFSGHGDVETQNDKKLGYLLAYNSPPNNYINNSLSLADLNQDANFISLEKKGKLVLVLDACHAGALAGDFFKGKNFVNKQLQTVLNNEVRLTACATDQEAAEGIYWSGGRGAFSYYLINGLNGLAEQTSDDIIKLNELQKFLDSCFVNEPYLKAQKHKQIPVLDGNPTYPLSFGAENSFKTFKSNFSVLAKSNSILADGLSDFSKVEPQPIDKLFMWLDSTTIEYIIDFSQYKRMPLSDFANAFVNDISQIQTKTYVNQVKKLLLNNEPFQKRFAKKFTEYVHTKGQKIINDYLEGNLAEIRKRDYYMLGEGAYKKFLDMHQIAAGLIPKGEHLADLMNINYHYLMGLIARISMPVSNNPDSLWNVSFAFQTEAKRLESNAAYINNELGILHLYKEQFDIAEKYFKMAAEISPTWAIPHINLISVYFAQRKLPQAREAILKAEELQPNLEYKQINAGLVMELEHNFLAAESNYLQAIANNANHYYPYERLGFVYVEKADFTKAEAYFKESEKLMPDFMGVFKFGLVLSMAQKKPTEPKTFEQCPGYDDKRKAFKLFSDGFRTAYFSRNYDSVAVTKIISGLKQHPTMPFAKHFLGKMYYKHGEWQKAFDFIIEAKQEYKNDIVLKQELLKILSIDSTSKSDNCLLENFIFFQYEPLEDDYLLADLYQKLDQPEKAIDLYKNMISIENGRRPLTIPFKDWNYSANSEYHLLAALKLAALYEKLGRFDLAEQTLTQQIFINTTPHYSTPTYSNIDFYWAENNSIYDKAICDFYQRMMERNPRDYQWPEKLGLWIHKLLNLSINRYIAFKNSEFLNYYIPIIGVKISKSILGTDENLDFVELENAKYIAYTYLKESVKLTGDEKPKVEVLMATANLAPWVDQYEEAIKLSNEVLLQEEKIESRNNLILLYEYKRQFPEVLTQLKALHKQNQLTNQQKVQFVQYLMLRNEHEMALNLMKNDSVMVDDLVYNYKLYCNTSQNLRKATKYLENGLKKIYSDKDSYENELQRILNNNEVLYIKARHYAGRNRNKKALSYLKKAVDGGFLYYKVIRKDPKFDKLSTLAVWTELLK